MSFLLEARTRGSEYVSMRRLASSQSKYDGPNQGSFCSFGNSLLPYPSKSVKREKSGHKQWQIDHPKAMDAKRGATKRRQDTSIMNRWRNDEIYRASLLAHGWIETWVKYLDHISKIDISHEARYRQRKRYESTLHMRGVDSNKQAGPLCQRLDY